MWVAARNIHPRIVAQLFHTERDAIFFLVKLEDFGFDFVAHRQHFGRVLDATPSQIGDVQQTIDAAQIHEGAIIGDVLHDTFNDRTFFQILHQRLTLRTLGCF